MKVAAGMLAAAALGFALVYGGGQLLVPSQSGTSTVLVHRVSAQVPKREVGYGLIRFNGRGPEAWNRAFRYERLKVRQLRRQLRRLRRRSHPSVRPLSSWQRSYASMYSWEDGGSRAQGCPHTPPLSDSDITFASGGAYPPTPGVACDDRVEFCFHRGRTRCVVATRTDSGPYANWPAHFDLNIGAAAALKFPGLGWLRWRLVK